MSSLIPERPIVISPSLATTIGLEESVFLHVLNDICSLTNGNNRQGYLWFNISKSDLERIMPFWNVIELQRISKSLKDKGVILIESPPLQQSEYLSYAMNEVAVHQTTQTRPSVTTKSAEHSANQRTSGASLLAQNWYPPDDLLQLLELNHNIPKDFALQQREDFVMYWQDRQQVSHSWPSKFRQHVLKQWRFHQSRLAEVETKQAQSNELNNSWNPSQDALEILYRTGVNGDFINDAIPEFVLYWRERGEAHSTWNSKFIAHIRRQWAIYTKSMELDYEPREIPANWQPSEDVYDILKLATIDIAFARGLVAEFVLFWRDTQQIQRSWNTKFLQHAKYQWATRHQMGQHYAGQQLTDRSTQSERKTTFEHLTDRSWAQNLVEGS
ncbi:MAG: DnaT-like ssDNA-binding domain-containing protein [Oceanicoccus sp.]